MAQTIGSYDSRVGPYWEIVSYEWNFITHQHSYIKKKPFSTVETPILYMSNLSKEYVSFELKLIDMDEKSSKNIVSTLPS